MAQNIDPERVKPFTPSSEMSAGMTKRQTDNVKSSTLEKNSQCRNTMKHPKTSEINHANV